jgi:magnesium chelatase family protein
VTPIRRNRHAPNAVLEVMETVRVFGASLLGCRAELVTVEARFEPRGQGQTEVLLTGLPDPVLRESRGRLLCVLEENRLRLGPGRLYLNLVPAARRKSGESLDLPLVLAAAGAGGHVTARELSGALFLGELGIDGALHAVPGGLPAGLAARDAAIGRVIAPPATAHEAAHVAALAAFGAHHLSEVLAHLTDPTRALARLTPTVGSAAPARAGPGLDDVRGQAAGKHALLIAAAGGHGLLYVGPPGTGKSMLARRLPRLLPPPSREERIELTCVLSTIGRWPGGLAETRPFRAPHHTASFAGLVGGGPQLAPGEVTLAHHGVLFLDELPEFRREALEALREPLETGAVTLSRAGRQVDFPARFQLVAAMNPCPCGYRGHPQVPCPCPPSHVRRYRRRISGPLLDRVDLRVELPPPSVAELTGRAVTRPGLGEADLRELVTAARAQQLARGQGVPNAALDAAALDRWAALDDAATSVVQRAAARGALSARALQSLRRVARTIADVDGAARVRPADLVQAVALRAPLTD